MLGGKAGFLHIPFSTSSLVKLTIQFHSHIFCHQQCRFGLLLLTAICFSSVCFCAKFCDLGFTRESGVAPGDPTTAAGDQGFALIPSMILFPTIFSEHPKKPRSGNFGPLRFVPSFSVCFFPLALYVVVFFVHTPP